MDNIFQATWGDRVGDILIHEDNRQSVWETKPAQVAILCRIRDRFLARGIEALVAAIYNPVMNRDEFAIFVEEGFLVA